MNDKITDELLFMLLDRSEISSDAATMVTHFMIRWQVSAYDALIECNIVSEPVLADLIAKYMQLTRIHALDAKYFSLSAFEQVPFEKATQLDVFPLGNSNGLGFHSLVVSTPFNHEIVSALELENNNCPKLLIAEKSMIRRWIEEFYPRSLQLQKYR
jgi:hypothetical protein